MVYTQLQNQVICYIYTAFCMSIILQYSGFKNIFNITNLAAFSTHILLGAHRLLTHWVAYVFIMYSAITTVTKT